MPCGDDCSVSLCVEFTANDESPVAEMRWELFSGELSDGESLLLAFRSLILLMSSLMVRRTSWLLLECINWLSELHNGLVILEGGSSGVSKEPDMPTNDNGLYVLSTVRPDSKSKLPPELNIESAEKLLNLLPADRIQFMLTTL